MLVVVKSKKVVGQNPDLKLFCNPPMGYLGNVVVHVWRQHIWVGGRVEGEYR